MLRPTWGFTKVREEGLVFRSQTNFLLPDSLVLGALAVLPQLEDLIEQFNETLAAPETLREM